ncbi:MAG: class I SAM-dependent methyltransferase [Chloroflexi bacterium]|nr:class I SAM-dependent methyltransferase [Chloroflexota bacterium]MBU1661185.1 class I SAM-dependent methyltransferase [Chloroflexota bacterium]
MDKYTHANCKLWNAWTKIHENSEFYNLTGFRAGQSSLKSIEAAELGDVGGKSLLHLQCHFGMDTLSWARLGAQVTGVDLSDEAITLARSLAEELNLEARFVCADIYELPQYLDGQFDIVFTSYGVLAWLGNLVPWAQAIAHFLKPGGVFYMVEIHPFSDTLDWERDKPELSVRYPYFYSLEPESFDAETSYADPNARHTDFITSYQWSHSLSDIVNALIGAGLRIEFFHEFPMTVFQQLPFMEQNADGWWRLPEGLPEIPLLFSLEATKSA